MDTPLAGKRGLLLLSGGFDSPVAGSMVRALGCDVGAVHFDQEPFTDAQPRAKALACAAVVGIRDVFVAPAGGPFAALAKEGQHRHYFVLMKRFMLRAAEALAREHGYDFLVTGDNMGQVSSQTLPNLAAIDAAATIPVVRPLLAFDKQEIIARARTLGTHDISAGPEHCDALGPRYPSTDLRREHVEADEARLDYAALVAHAVGGARRAEPASLATASAGSSC